MIECYLYLFNYVQQRIKNQVINKSLKKLFNITNS